jgi:hypothetical protein
MFVLEHKGDKTKMDFGFYCISSKRLLQNFALGMHNNLAGQVFET